MLRFDAIFALIVLRWPKLVELHKIPLIIDRNNDFRTAEDWLIPERADDCYQIQVSIGFDPSRANPHGSNNANSFNNTFIGGQACSLLIFSRISGRLFLKHDDARGVLRLTNSGTNFCQGLTIIVDDFEGNLPLTPTKESLAFGMEDNGKIHERNLYAWLGALANVYWTHFHNMYKTKKALGDAIKSKLNRVSELGREETSAIPTLKNGSFSTVEKLFFSRERVKNSIRPFKSDDTTWTNGPDTLIKLGGNPRPKPERRGRPKKPTAATGKHELATTTTTTTTSSFSVLDGYDSDGNDLMTGSPPPPGIFDDAASEEFDNAASEHRSEGFNNAASEGDEQTPMRERLDGRPVRSKIKPQRFDELQTIPTHRKKRHKAMPGGLKSSDDKGGDPLLKKKLKDTKAELKETQAELNASKATCDDLQMLLEEREQAGTEESKTEESKKILQLTNELNKIEEKHNEELQRIRTQQAEKIDAMRVRIRELEARNTTVSEVSDVNGAEESSSTTATKKAAADRTSFTL